MQVNVEKLSPVLLEVQIAIPAEQVRSEVDKAYSVLQRTARVRGYRPGKAPKHVLAHLFAGRVYADVAQRLVDETLDRALSEQQVKPLSKPSIMPNELSPESGFSYKARFEVAPEIAEVKWQGFEVKRPNTTPSDDMIDAEITRLRKEHSTMEVPNPARPARTGDTVTINFTLELDGKEREPKDQEIETELGSGQIFREIEDALIGLSAGESKDAAVAFPERHQNPEFRGKEGIFHLTLKDVRERVFPEIDNEFAKDCGQESLEALRASLRDNIEKDLKQKAINAVAEQLVIELCKANPIDVPLVLVEQQSQITERELLATARKQGQRVEPNAEFRAHVRADSEMKVRAGLLMAAIAKSQDVKVTEADLEKAYEELAEQTGKNVAKVKAEYRDPKKREMLIGMVVEDRILDIIEGAAKVNESA